MPAGLPERESDWEEWLARGLGAWVVASARRARLVCALSALVVLASVAYVVVQLTIDADTEAMLSDELPFRQAEIAFERAFPEFDNDLLIVVDAPTVEAARQATGMLAEALRAESDRFHNVFVPGGGPFFETQGLLYLSPGELEQLGDRLARAQPFLAELARDPSLRGLFTLLEQSLRAEADVEGRDLERVLERVARAVETVAQDRTEAFLPESLLLGDVVGEDTRRRLIVTNPTIDFSRFLPAAPAMERVRELARELRLAETTGARVRLTGDLALSTEELGTVEDQAALAGLASLLMVAAILGVALRSLRLILATVATLLAGLVTTAGFATLAIGHLNLLSVTFAVLFIGLGIDFGIHLCLRYRELQGDGASPASALRAAGADVGGALVLCALTTAIGFYAFLPTGYAGVAELGLISGTGMFVSLAFTLTLLPALLGLGEGPAPVYAAGRPPLPVRWAGLPARHPRVVRGVAAALALGSLLLLPRVRFDANPLSVRDPSAESVGALRDLLADAPASPWGVDVLAPDRAAARRLVARLDALPAVARALSVDDLVPDRQEEKRAILEEISFFLALPPEGAEYEPPRPAERSAALERLRARAHAFSGSAADSRVAASAEQLARALDALAADPEGLDARLVRLEESLIPPLAGSVERLRRALSPGRVTFETLPPELVRRFVTGDGGVRVQAYPRADLDDGGALEVFVDQVLQVAPDAVGGAVRIVESARTIEAALRRALATAVVAIALLLLVLWRRPRDAALVLAPLLLAALFTCAFSVLADVPFNFADVIVLPLLLGIGVDSGIHLVHRWRHADTGRAELLGTSSARGIFWSAATTVASFGSLGFSTHLGMASLGQMLTVGVLLMLLCNLVVLPALLPERRPD